MSKVISLRSYRLERMRREVTADLLSQPPESFPPAARASLERIRKDSEGDEEIRKAILARAPYLADWVTSRCPRRDSG